MLLEKNTKLLFIGDSITDADRDHQAGGEGRDDKAYGSGYVNLIRGWLQANNCEHKIRVVNQGISSNTIRDLKNRWQKDVLEHNPDYLSIFIGINDVWRHFNRPRIQEEHVSIEEYSSSLEELIQKSQNSIPKIILMTPYMIEAYNDDPMKQMMQKYAQEVIKMAEKYNCLLVDTQNAFDKYLKHAHSYSIAMDRIHPNIIGHTILAREWMKTLQII